MSVSLRKSTDLEPHQALAVRLYQLTPHTTLQYKGGMLFVASEHAKLTMWDTGGSMVYVAGFTDPESSTPDWVERVRPADYTRFIAEMKFILNPDGWSLA